MAVTSAFASPSTPAMSNPANPRRSLRSVNSGGAPVSNPDGTTTPVGSTGTTLIQPRQPIVDPWRNVGTGPFGSLGNTANIFGRQDGAVRSQEEQAGRSSMMQSLLANGGGWRFDGNYGGAGGGNANNPYSFDNAFRQSQSNQNAASGLVAQGRQNIAPLMQQAQAMFSNAPGLDPAALGAMNDAGAMANARAMAGIQRDSQNALAAGGFSGSPASAYIDAQTRGMATQSDLDRRAQIALQDAEARNANRQFAGQWLAQLLGLDTQSAMQGADIMGRFQTPYLTPDAASAMGYGGGGGGTGMPQGQFSSQQNNNQGSSRYLEQLMMNQSPAPQQNTGGYRLGPNQTKPYNAPSWLAG